MATIRSNAKSSRVGGSHKVSRVVPISVQYCLCFQDSGNWEGRTAAYPQMGETGNTVQYNLTVLISRPKLGEVPDVPESSPPAVQDVTLGNTHHGYYYRDHLGAIMGRKSWFLDSIVREGGQPRVRHNNIGAERD